MRKLASLLFFIFPMIMLANIPAEEQNALKELFYSTNGKQWNNSWDFNTTPEHWYGVTVQNNRVVGLNLMFNNLTGVLPPSLGNLTALKKLELSFNNISGTLPLQLGNLKNLEILALNGNNITGNIPTQLGQLTQLKQLHLSSNRLSGNIPTTLENLTRIEVFNVFQNNLSGKIPEKIIANKLLQELVIAENNFEESSQISTTLLLNASKLTFNETPLNISTETIAIETEDDGN